MIKQNIYESLSDQLKAKAKDRLFHFFLSADEIRGAFIHATHLVKEMQYHHAIGLIETLVLGHAYMGATLMTIHLKGPERLALKIDCSGPIQGLLVEANALGEVRGYLKKVPIPVNAPLKDFNMSPFFGAGFLEITKFLKDAKHPYKGRVILAHGNIGQDLAHYCLTSEQIPTAMTLSVHFDQNGAVTGAGGLLLQAMPGASESAVTELENQIKTLPSIGGLLDAEFATENWLMKTFAPFEPRIIANHRIEFMCHCNRERFLSYIGMLPLKDLDEMLHNGPFPMATQCHHCNSTYTFEKDEITSIYQERTQSH